MRFKKRIAALEKRSLCNSELLAPVFTYENDEPVMASMPVYGFESIHREMNETADEFVHRVYRVISRARSDGQINVADLSDETLEKCLEALEDLFGAELTRCDPDTFQTEAAVGDSVLQTIKKTSYQ